MTHTITILGSTGSIGRQTLSVAEELGLRVAALTAEKNVDLLEAQCRKYRPELAVMTENAAAEELKTRLADMNIRVLAGAEALCEAAALPEIFRKVAEAKRMLETGETDKVNEAAKAVGISRSAFYKYRDTIAPFQNMMAGRIITFQLMLKHKAGILSEILSIFANCGANILTINQAIPSGGRAMVTVSAETGNLGCSLEEFTRRLGESTGVVKAEVVAG